MNLGDLKIGLKSSYKNNTAAEKELLKSGYTLDKSLSGKRAKVYTDESGQPTVAFRGTNTFKDIVTDFAIPLGLAQNTNRMQHSKSLVKKVEEKYSSR